MAEIITVERRRRWSDLDKARIVAETFEPDAGVSEVARQHGLHGSQLFAWRKLVRDGSLRVPTSSAATFAPVIVAPGQIEERSSSPAVMAERSLDSRSGASGRMEIVIGRGRRITVFGRCRHQSAGSRVARTGAAMISLPPGVRVWLAVGRTDMRKGFDGLAMLAQEQLQQDPFSGQLFVFRGRNPAGRICELCPGTAGSPSCYRPPPPRVARSVVHLIVGALLKPHRIHSVSTSLRRHRSSYRPRRMFDRPAIRDGAQDLLSSH